MKFSLFQKATHQVVEVVDLDLAIVEEREPDLHPGQFGEGHNLNVFHFGLVTAYAPRYLDALTGR